MSIGLLIVLYTGVTGGLTTLFDYGLIPGIRYLFDPTLFTPFFAVLTLIQDILLIVGLIFVIAGRPDEEAQSNNPEVTVTNSSEENL